MATEKLIVELDAKTPKLDAALARTNKSLDNLDDQLDKTIKKQNDLTAAFKKGAAATAVLVTGMAALARQTSEYAKQLDIAATRSNQSVEDFQVFAFSAKSVGVEMEKLGDIGKDVQERIGEFIATGSGGFQDFADVMGLTASEASKFARSLDGLSSQEILQTLVDQMESAGVSGSKMSFALEGLASDTTDLIPLLEKGGNKMEKLSDEFFDITDTLNQAEVNKLKEIGKEFNKLGEILTVSGAKISSDFNGAVILAIQLFGKLVEVGSGAIRLVGQGFENIGTLIGAGLAEIVSGGDVFKQAVNDMAQESKDMNFDIFGEDNNLINMIVGDPDKALEDWRRTQELIAKGAKKTGDITVTTSKEEIKWADLTTDSKTRAVQDYARAAQGINETLFDDNKAFRAGMVVVDTAAGITRAFSDLPYPAALAASASIAATGIAQLAAINSASKGGGSISGSSTVSGSSSPQQDFQPETSSLDVTEQVEGEGVQTLRVVIEDSDGNSYLDAISNLSQEKMARN